MTDTSRLEAAARRALDSLADLITDNLDPGTEALAALHELRQALIPSHAAKPEAPDCDGCGHPEHPAEECQATSYGERCTCDEPLAVDGLREQIKAALREHKPPHLDDVPSDEYDCCANAVMAVRDRNMEQLRAKVNAAETVREAYKLTLAQGNEDAAELRKELEYWQRSCREWEAEAQRLRAERAGHPVTAAAQLAELRALKAAHEAVHDDQPRGCAIPTTQAADL